jgi:hypothetical protein
MRNREVQYDAHSYEPAHDAQAPKTIETSSSELEVRQTDWAKTAGGGRMMAVAPGEEAACST